MQPRWLLLAAALLSPPSIAPAQDAAAGADLAVTEAARALEAAAAPGEASAALESLLAAARLDPVGASGARALHLAGRACRRLGRYREAAALQRRVALDHPGRPEAEAALWESAHCLALAGDAPAALEDLQRLRDRFPESSLARQALAPLTLLFRLAGPGSVPLALDPAFAPVAPEDVVALAASGDAVWAMSRRARRVAPLQGPGPAETLAEEPRGIGFGPSGERVVVTRASVRVGEAAPLRLAVPAGRAGESGPLDRIASAALGRSGLFVADERRSRIHRFDRSGAWLGAFPDERERPATRLVADGEGGLFVLDAERRSIEAFDEWGRAIAWPAEALPLRRPVDLAVDAFRNVYVADDEAGLLVISSEGRLRFTLGGEELRRPAAVAVSPSGVCYVFDARTRRVVSYR